RDRGAAVRLLDADVARAALLLERISPGTPLPGGDDAIAVAVAAGLLSRLHAAPRPAFPFPSLAGAYPLHERRARADAAHERRTRGAVPAGLPLLPRARAAAMRLCASSARDVLLHGDFLDKNLLWDGARYVAIDPMPRVGDPCADIGFFAAAHPPAAAMLERAGALAERLGEDRARAARWTAVWAAGEACETWRADSSQLAAAVTSAAVERLLDL
ncbi:MAG TPA: aminoglycoside phosphotransferase family protein, partial [Candidatus Dormibacteraeota bacterium]